MLTFASPHAAIGVGTRPRDACNSRPDVQGSRPGRQRSGQGREFRVMT